MPRFASAVDRFRFSQGAKGAISMSIPAFFDFSAGQTLIQLRTALLYPPALLIQYRCKKTSVCPSFLPLLPLPFLFREAQPAHIIFAMIS